jgi:outer membrane protein OmpA-like peptidoglycan-associated protein
MENIQFEFRSAELQPRCMAKIAKLADWMKADTHVTLLLDSHQYDAEANDFVPGLGARRAEEVRGALIAAGIAPQRLTIGSLGGPRQLCGEPTDACRALNRRVEVLAARQ